MKIKQITVAVSMSVLLSMSCSFFDSDGNESREYELTVGSAGNGTTVPSGAVTVDHNGATSISATPGAGWVFEIWEITSGTGAIANTTSPFTTVTLTEGNAAVSAVFIQSHYSLSVNTAGSGHVTKIPDQTAFASGSSVECTAVPETGWSFDSWEGDLTGSDNPGNLTMDGNKSVTAVFAVDYFAKAYGGTSSENFQSIRQTTDGGYIAGGATGSFPVGSSKAWVVKLDSTGDIEWEKVYAGSIFQSIQEVSTGGYIGAGYSTSSLPNSFRIIRMDSAGDILWHKMFYGDGQVYSNALGHDIDEASDGGFIAAGQIVGTETATEFWVIKLSAGGVLEWEKTFGGSSQDYGRAIQSTADGGCIVAGESYSSDWGFGSYDAWVLKLDSSGSIEWQNTYGGGGIDNVQDIYANPDGSFVICGYTESSSAGYSDLWVLKGNTAGEIEWETTLGGYDGDSARSVRRTSDGGYIVAGNTSTYRNYGAGGSDAWVVKLSSSGGVQWERAFGGPEADGARFAAETADGGYVVGGLTESFGVGSYDAWLIKLSADGTCGSFGEDTSGTPSPGTGLTSVTTATVGGTGITGADVTNVTEDTNAVVTQQTP